LEQGLGRRAKEALGVVAVGDAAGGARRGDVAAVVSVAARRRW
jgi:hypothetical protein